MKISFIWFDLGYTLLYQQREEPYRAVLAELGYESPGSASIWSTTSRTSSSCASTPASSVATPGTFAPWFLGVLNHRSASAPTCAGTWQLLKRTSAHGHSGWCPSTGSRTCSRTCAGAATGWASSRTGTRPRARSSPRTVSTASSSRSWCRARPGPREARPQDLRDRDGRGSRGCHGVPVRGRQLLRRHRRRARGRDGVGRREPVPDRRGVEEIIDVSIIEHIREIAGWLQSGPRSAHASRARPSARLRRARASSRSWNGSVW